MDMKLTDILEDSCIQLNIEASDKNSVLTELVDVLAATGKVQDRDDDHHGRARRDGEFLGTRSHR